MLYHRGYVIIYLNKLRFAKKSPPCNPHGLILNRYHSSHLDSELAVAEAAVRGVPMWPGCLCPRAARAADEGGRRDEHEAEHEDAEEEEHADHAGHRRLAARRLAAAAALGARLEAGLVRLQPEAAGPLEEAHEPLARHGAARGGGGPPRALRRHAHLRGVAWARGGPLRQ